MVIKDSVKIKNYKCFGDTPQGFQKIFPVNIIIGKNNSGKSSLVDLVDYLINPEKVPSDKSNKKLETELVITTTFNSIHNQAFDRNVSGGRIPGQSHYAYGSTLIGKDFEYVVQAKKLGRILKPENLALPEAFHYLAKIEQKLEVPLNGKSFFRISAERDIRPEEGKNPDSIEMNSNGEGATNLIRQIINWSRYDRTIIEKDVLSCLNEIVFPDIEFDDIVVQENGSNIWEVYLEDKQHNLIPLSKMGSGIKTILLVILNLIVVPKILDKKLNEFVFGFEELENNLHPSLLRRLFNYIISFAELNKSYFFITTHSSIVIDLFGTNNNAQIVHVENKHGHGYANTIVAGENDRKILRDLEVKPSDLLLSNGIIWLEGPSDVIIVELLLNLYKNFNQDSDKRRFNYTIQSLSTSIWKYCGFTDFDWNQLNEDLQNKIISLEKLNHNHILVIDKDDNYEDKKPSEWKLFSNGTGKNKAKLLHESMLFADNDETNLINNSGDAIDDKLFFWVNLGTIETYLEFFIRNRGKSSFSNYFDMKNKRGYFEKRRNGAYSSKSKVELANEIASYAFENNLSIIDFAPVSSELFNKVNRLYNTIKSWN